MIYQLLSHTATSSCITLCQSRCIYLGTWAITRHCCSDISLDLERKHFIREPTTFNILLPTVGLRNCNKDTKSIHPLVLRMSTILTILTFYGIQVRLHVYRGLFYLEKRASWQLEMLCCIRYKTDTCVCCSDTGPMF